MNKLKRYIGTKLQNLKSLLRYKFLWSGGIILGILILGIFVLGLFKYILSLICLGLGIWFLIEAFKAQFDQELNKKK